MSDPCTALENELKALENELTSITSSWGHDFDDVGPGGKAAVVKEHQQETQAVKAKIAQKKAQFENCLRNRPRVPLTVAVSGVNCIEENDLSANDEPYVLVCTVDLKSPMTISLGGKSATVPIPRAKVTLTGPWPGVSSGEYGSVNELPANHRRAFWNTIGKPAPITNPDNVIFLVGLMENDDADPDGVRAAVGAAMSGNLASEPANLDRATLVKELKNDYNGALKAAAPAGLSLPANTDDVIGGCQELRLTTLDLGWVAHQGSWSKSLNFAGEGARYRVDFILKKG
jgi:hypothetical protein